MNGPFNTGRARRRPSINVTSLIDVMFLLLIFFMVSSTFKQDSAIEITLPEAESATARELTTHEITVDAAGTTYFAGRPVDETQLRAELTAILRVDPNAPIVLRADEGANVGRFVRVIDIVESLGGKNLMIPTAPLRTDRDSADR